MKGVQSGRGRELQCVGVCVCGHLAEVSGWVSLGAGPASLSHRVLC